MNEKDRDKQERQRFQKKLGKHLVTLMKEKNIGSTELAERCFMEKPNIMRIRRGDINPSAFVLNKLCEGLDISLEDFFKGFDTASKKRPKK